MTDVVINFHLKLNQQSKNIKEFVQSLQKDMERLANKTLRGQNKIQGEFKQTTTQIQQTTRAIREQERALDRIRGKKYSPFVPGPKAMQDFKTLVPAPFNARGQPVDGMGNFAAASMLSFGGFNVARGIEKSSVANARRMKELSEAQALMGMNWNWDNDKSPMFGQFNTKKQLAQTTMPVNFGRSIERQVVESVGRGVTTGFGNKVPDNWLPANIPTGKNIVGQQIEDMARLRQQIPIVGEEFHKMGQRASTAKERAAAFPGIAKSQPDDITRMVQTQLERQRKGTATFSRTGSGGLPIVDFEQFTKVGERSSRAISRTGRTVGKTKEAVKELGFVTRQSVEGTRRLGAMFGLASQDAKKFNHAVLTSANSNKALNSGLAKVGEMGRVTDLQMSRLNATLSEAGKSNIHAATASKQLAQTFGLNRREAEAMVHQLTGAPVVMANVQKRTTMLDRAVRGLATAFGMLRGAIVYGLFLLVTAAVAALTAEVFKFDNKMREMNSLLRTSEKGFQAMKDEVIALSTIVPKTASDLANGLRDVVSAGFRGADSMRMLKATSVLATGAFVDNKVATKALVTTMNAYGLGAEHAGAVSDILFSTMEYGIITMSEISEHFAKFTPLAAQAKVPLHEVAAAMAVMTKKGVSAGRASTGLQRIMSRLIRQDDGDKLMNSLGGNVSATTLAQRGLVGVIEELNTALGNSITKNRDAVLSVDNYRAAINLLAQDASGISAETLSEMFPDMETLQTVVMLAGEAGGEIIEIAEKIKASQGATKNAFQEASKAYQFQVNILRNRLSAAWIHFASSVLPTVIKGLGIAASVVLGFTRTVMFLLKHIPLLIAGGVAMATVFYGSVSGAFYAAAIAAGSFWSAVLAPVVPIIAAVAAVVGAIGGIVQSFKAASESAHESQDWLVEIWNVMQDGIKGAIILIYGLVYAVGYVITAVVAYVEWCGRIWAEIGKYMVDVWKFYGGDIKKIFKHVVEDIKEVFAKGIEALMNKWDEFLDWMVARWHQSKELFMDGKLDNILDAVPGGRTLMPIINAIRSYRKALAAESEGLGSAMSEPLEDGIEDTAATLPNLWERLTSVKFKDLHNKWMERIGLGKTPAELWAELEKLLPDVTSREDIKEKFMFAIETDFDANMQALLDELSTEVAQVVQQANASLETINAMSGATMNVIGAFKNAALAMVNLGHDANQVSGILKMVKDLQIQKMIVDLLSDMKTMSETFLTEGLEGGLQYGRINMALEEMAQAFLMGADEFLTALLDLGSPEELAELFAKQNYISQNVNQNVVISPYIQIDGTENPEEILQIVDEALTSWAEKNGMATGR